jgi:hypothetical protein
MKPLLLHFLRHIWHSKILFSVLLISIFIHYSALSLLRSSSVTVQGVVSTIGARQGFYISVFLDLFCGFFLSAAFGIWLMTYFYEKTRASLYFVLPISKWIHVASHAIIFVLLVFFQKIVSLILYLSIFKNEAFTFLGSNLSVFLISHLFELLVFLTMSFVLALGSLVLGPVVTFFAAGIYFFVSQIFGIFFKFNWSALLNTQTPKVDGIKSLYDVLPPVGNIIFDLRVLMGGENTTAWGLWAVWLAIFVSCFYFKIKSRPQY